MVRTEPANLLRSLFILFLGIGVDIILILIQRRRRNKYKYTCFNGTHVILNEAICETGHPLQCQSASKNDGKGKESFIQAFKYKFQFQYKYK